MKSKHFFWGILFISVGILWILKSLGVISFSWCVFAKLWPLIFIWIGIKLIPISDNWKIFLNTTVLLIGITALLIISNSKCYDSKWERTHYCFKEFTICDESDTLACYPNGNIIEYEDYENAYLNLSASAGKLTFASGEHLIAIREKESPRSKIIMNSTVDEDNNIKIKADIEPFKKKISRKDSYKYKILLNSSPVWNIALELNATAGQINLSEFKIRELEIESNASALDLKLGSFYSDVNLKIESNASSVKLTIPYNMKCLLTKEDSTLSSFSVKGLKKQDNNQYVSTGEEETAGVINIIIEANVSSVEIKRY